MFFVVDFFCLSKILLNSRLLLVSHVAYPNLQAFHPGLIETTPDLPDTVSLRIQASRLSV
jgi:hypothetical protein